MAKKIIYAVVLTSQAIDFLKDDLISTFLTKSKYFKREAIEPNDRYLYMKLVSPIEYEGRQVYELSIPHEYVLYMV